MSPERSFRARLRDLGLSGPFARAVMTLISGTGIGQILVVASGPVITRLYSPSDLGIFGLYFAFISFFQPAMGLMYDRAIVSAPTRSEAAHLTVIAEAMVLPMTLLAALIMYIMIESRVLGYDRLPLVAVPILAGGLFLAGTYTTLHYWLVRERQFRLIAREEILRGGGRGATQVFAGFAGLNWVGLALGDLAGRGLGIGPQMLAASADLTTEARSLRRDRARQLLRKYRIFPIFSLPSILLNSAVIDLPGPYLVATFGVATGGFYALDLRVLSLPVSLIADSVSDVFHSRIAEIGRSDPGRARPFMLQTAAILFLMGIGPAIVLILFGESLFATAFGSRWREAGHLAGLMAPWYLALFCVYPISRVVYVFRGQRLKLVYDATSLALTVGVFLISRAAQFSLEQTILALSLANAFTYIIYLPLLIRIAPSRDATAPISPKWTP